MTDRPKLLDLYCGSGGAARGYQLAGFHVTGVDMHPQPRYAGDVFIQGDALEYALSHGWQFDCIHSSPPCQIHSNITPDKSKHLDLIPQTRFVLQSLGLPFIIENVAGAKKALRNPVMLCGADFGLKVYRHRFFESNVTLYVPEHAPHGDSDCNAGHSLSKKGYISIAGHFGGTYGMTQDEWNALQVNVGKAERYHERYGKRRYISGKGFITVAGTITGVAYARYAMQIDWMTREELTQAIPPAYTFYLGEQLMAHINGEGLPIQRKMFA